MQGITPLYGPERTEITVRARVRVNVANPAATFFAELKQRNVYKVAVAYGVVAWRLVLTALSARSALTDLISS
jgi:hypothetical protein